MSGLSNVCFGLRFQPVNAKRNPPKRVFAISRLKAADFTARLKTGEVSSIGKR
jgi:hypothetical protein